MHLAHLPTKASLFFAFLLRQQYSSPQGVTHLRAAGEENFQCPSKSLISRGNFGRRRRIHTCLGRAIPACAARAACGQLSVTRTALPCCTDLPEAHGVGRTLGGSWVEAFSGRTTHIDMLPLRNEIPSRSSPTRRHKLDRVRASRLAYSQLCWHAQWCILSAAGCAVSSCVGRATGVNQRNERHDCGFGCHANN